MLKLLLAFALASSQLLSLGTGALYLCIGGDGSVCLNANPESCTCCENCSEPESKDDRETCSCSCEHACAVKATIAQKVIADVDGCQCTHLLLSSGQFRPQYSDSNLGRQLGSFVWLSFPPAVSLDDIATELTRSTNSAGADLAVPSQRLNFADRKIVRPKTPVAPTTQTIASQRDKNLPPHAE
jgi:hypothetical protein